MSSLHTIGSLEYLDNDQLIFDENSIDMLFFCSNYLEREKPSTRKKNVLQKIKTYIARLSKTQKPSAKLVTTLYQLLFGTCKNNHPSKTAKKRNKSFQLGCFYTLLQGGNDA